MEDTDTGTDGRHHCSTLLGSSVPGNNYNCKNGVTARERENKNETTTIEETAEQFEQDGFVYLPSVFEVDLIGNLRQVAERNFEECHSLMYDLGRTPFPESRRRKHQHKSEGEFDCEVSIKGHATDDENETTEEYEYAMGIGIKNGYREIVMRSPGRYEMTYKCYDETFPLDKILQSDFLIKAAMSCLRVQNFESEDGCCAEDVDDTMKITNISIVMSTPGSTDQKWHSDGGHVDLNEHKTCHCLNAFIPLVDMTVDLGPTEFRPGTHYHTRNLTKMLLLAKAKKTLRPTEIPLPKMGDVLLFDYRILHRGLANKGTEHRRPILVVTFSKKWFCDILNFPKRSFLIVDDENQRL